MPLQVDEMGIQFSVGQAPPAQTSNDNGCCDDDDDAKQRATEDRLVSRVTQRVLAALKAERMR